MEFKVYKFIFHRKLPQHLLRYSMTLESLLMPINIAINKCIISAEESMQLLISFELYSTVLCQSKSSLTRYKSVQSTKKRNRENCACEHVFLRRNEICAMSLAPGTTTTTRYANTADNKTNVHRSRKANAWLMMDDETNLTRHRVIPSVKDSRWPGWQRRRMRERNRIARNVALIFRCSKLRRRTPRSRRRRYSLFTLCVSLHSVGMDARRRR